MKRPLMAAAVVPVVLALLAVFVSACGKRQTSAKIEKQTRFLMNTYCTIQVPACPGAADAINVAFKRMHAIDTKFNVLNPESPLYRFNQRGEPVKDAEIVYVVSNAMDVARLSDGALDVTVYSVSKLWGFYTDAPSLPDADTIGRVLPSVDWKNLSIEGGVLTRLSPKTQIDLGGIAKGYGAGEAAKVLKEQGMKSALVDAGGNICAFGLSPAGFWKIGVRNPRGEGVIAAMELFDASVATSGDYERFFETNGVRYCHIIDPRTGYPVNELASVTIVHKDPMIADALSTAAFVLGMERGLAFLQEYPGAEGLLIGRDGTRKATSGLASTVTSEHLPAKK